eukprot:m.258898 g.258898  ORF g.258898 m.258898 type:complete len:584 (+) comp32817_c0_seq1:263-2014(+)
MHAGGRKLPRHIVAAGFQLRLVERGVRRAGLQGRVRGFGHQRPHVAKADMAEQVHEVARPGERGIGIFRAVLHEEHHRRLQVLRRRFQRVEKAVLQRLVLRVLLQEALHHLEESHGRLAALGGQFAAHEVKRLNAVRALVDHRDPGVAGELGHAPFLDIAVTAIDLLGLDGHGKALVGQEALDHRRQQRDQALGLLVAQPVRAVDQVRAPQGEGAGAFDKAFLVHQHPADIGVHDQRIGIAARVLGAGHRAALQPVLGIGQRVLIGDLGLRIALQAHAQTRLVHHHEHRPHPLVEIAHKVAGRAVIVHHAGGVAVDAHLFFDLADRDAVALAQRAVLFHEELGHDEERDALRALATAGRLGQHQMDDVLGQVVIARRDKDLLAGDLVAAVVLRFGLGADETQIGATMRLGQVHRAGPFQAGHLRQIGLLLFIGASGEDRVDRAVGQALIHVEGHVRGHEQLAHAGGKDIGQVLTAIFLGQVEPVPAAFADLRECVLEARGGVDHAVFQPAALGVADGVERRQHALGQLAGFFEDRRGEIGFELVITRDPGRGGVEDLVQQELHVLDGRGIGRHRSLLWGWGAA